MPRNIVLWLFASWKPSVLDVGVARGLERLDDQVGVVLRPAGRGHAVVLLRVIDPYRSAREGLDHRRHRRRRGVDERKILI